MQLSLKHFESLLKQNIMYLKREPHQSNTSNQFIRHVEYCTTRSVKTVVPESL